MLSTKKKPISFTIRQKITLFTEIATKPNWPVCSTSCENINLFGFIALLDFCFVIRSGIRQKLMWNFKTIVFWTELASSIWFVNYFDSFKRNFHFALAIFDFFTYVFHNLALKTEKKCLQLHLVRILFQFFSTFFSRV